MLTTAVIIPRYCYYVVRLVYFCNKSGTNHAKNYHAMTNVPYKIILTNQVKANHVVQITWYKLLSALYFNGTKYCKHHQTNKQTNQTVFLGVLGETALRQIVTNELSYHYLFQADITSLLKLILYIYNTFHQTKIRAPSQLHWDLVTWLPEKRLDARKWSQTSCRRMNFLWDGWPTSTWQPYFQKEQPWGENQSRIAETAICSVTTTLRRHYRVSRTRFLTKSEVWTSAFAFSCQIFGGFHSC